MKPSPVLVVTGIVLAMLVGAIGYYVYTRHTFNQELEKEIDQLKLQVAAHQAKVARKAEAERNSKRIERRFEDVVQILPLQNPQQGTNVENSLTAFSSAANLEFVRFIQKEAPKPAPGRPGQPGTQQQLLREFGDRFEPTEVTVEYKGTFFQFLKFLSAVDNNKEFLRVDSVSLVPTGAPGAADAARLLSITVTLSTFHYKLKG